MVDAICAYVSSSSSTSSATPLASPAGRRGSRPSRIIGPLPFGLWVDWCTVLDRAISDPPVTTLEDLRDEQLNVPHKSLVLHEVLSLILRDTVISRQLYLCIRRSCLLRGLNTRKSKRQLERIIG